ncbi:MAG: F0F1 ATP synthase subunit epsilon [Alphaproteobacteria bacterium GM202ARS2]|nr:F0F1 ATP synthase subunit epsilon [Alphaproteobacteria bacterium GM202ARS2]
MTTLSCRLTTPQQCVVEDNVDSVVLPGVDGDFAVMAGHSLLFTPLRQGVIRIGHKSYTISRGYAHVSATACRIMVESVDA